MDIFKKAFLESVSIEFVPILLMFILATLLGFLIAWTYRKTHRGFSYSQSFSLTLILMTVITAFIIVLIEDSFARALGIFGAFSIIRFRTAIKDVRDIAFVFFALSVGLAVGAGLVFQGIVWTLLISALIFVLNKMNFGGLRKLEYVLNFKMDSKQHSNDIFKGVMTEHLKKQMLLNVDSKDRGNYLVFMFNISLKDNDSLNTFIASMNELDGISDVNVVSSKNDLEF